MRSLAESLMMYRKAHAGMSMQTALLAGVLVSQATQHLYDYMIMMHMLALCHGQISHMSDMILSKHEKYLRIQS